MTTASDNFNRADSGTLGANWTIQPGAGNDGISIVSNEIRATTLDQFSAQFFNAVVFDQNQFASLRLITNTISAALTAGGPALRASNSADTLYHIQVRNAGGNTSGIFKRIGGVNTQLAVESATTWVSGDVITGQVVRTSLTLWRNGSILLTAVDPDIATGQPGARIFVNTPGALSDLEFDDWSASDFAKVDYSRFPKPNIAEAALRGEM